MTNNDRPSSKQKTQKPNVQEKQSGFCVNRSSALTKSHSTLHKTANSAFRQCSPTETSNLEPIYNKTLNSAKVREKVQTSRKELVFRCRGLLARQGASLEMSCLKQAPISLWPLGATGVQIPLPAPFYNLELFLRFIGQKSRFGIVVLSLKNN
jgi:hypothetical protein